MVLGVNPTQWAKNKGIKPKDIRDNLSIEQLKLLTYLEERNCALLDLDTSTAQRKTQLTKLAQRWLCKEGGIVMVNLILRVSFKLDTLTTEISRILNLIDSGETAPLPQWGISLIYLIFSIIM